MDEQYEKEGAGQLPVVAIDGARIRGIREEKKLTQLYVASVVGVTTDTISRWENNRYPRIRRDNAEKLAAALETDVSEILLDEMQETAPLPPEPPVAAQPKGSRWMVASGVLLILALAACWYLYRQYAAPVRAVRWLPHYGAPGDVIPVRVSVERRGPGIRGFIIKERLPAGWRLVNSRPPVAAGQAAADEVKWLVPAGKGPVVILYTTMVAATASGKDAGGFEGSIVAQGREGTRTSTVSGDHAVTTGGIHWADGNGDGRIDDSEIMPAYYLTEEMKGLGLDWTLIETIWNAKGYVWDGRLRQFRVVGSRS